MAFIHWITDVVGIFLFCICIFHARKRGTIYVFEVISAFLYGFGLEYGNMVMSGGYYFYSTEFPFMVLGVPFAIAMGWSAIIYTSMIISDNYGLERKFRPWFDTLLAIGIDLSMDAVATRLEFWTWPLGLNEGFYGVPYSNFVGWYFVVLFFSTFSRIRRWYLEERENPIKTRKFVPVLIQLLIPLLSIVCLWGCILSNIHVADSIFPDHTSRMMWFWMYCVIGLAIVCWGFIRMKDFHPKKMPVESFIVHFMFHGIFFAALFVFGFWVELPLFILISSLLIIAELTIHLLPEISKLAKKRGG